MVNRDDRPDQGGQGVGETTDPAVGAAAQGRPAADVERPAEGFGAAGAADALIAEGGLPTAADGPGPAPSAGDLNAGGLDAGGMAGEAGAGGPLP